MKLISVKSNELPKIEVSKKDRLQTINSSKGVQVKWKKGDMFLKLNSLGTYQDVSEVLSSHLLSFTNINYFVEYKSCIIVEDGKALGVGCYSKNFLNEGEQDITLYRLLRNLGVDLGSIDYESTLCIVQNFTGLNIKNYIDNCICLDSIIFNEDRHLNNLSIIKTPTGYREAPIYDNGLGCLVDIMEFPLEEDLYSLLATIRSKPFKKDFKEQIISSKAVPIKLDKVGFLNTLEIQSESEIESRAIKVIKYGLNKMEGISWC